MRAVAIDRINGIANDLLSKVPKPSRGHGEKVSEIIESIIAEKSAQFSEHTISFDPGSDDHFIDVDGDHLKRVISNLIHNSIESMSEAGRVDLKVLQRGGFSKIQIKDNGKGIPPEVLARLGRRGETHGKIGGNGLGLYHAIKWAREAGGTLNIESRVGEGTLIELQLKLAKEN